MFRFILLFVAALTATASGTGLAGSNYTPPAEPIAVTPRVMVLDHINYKHVSVRMVVYHHLDAEYAKRHYKDSADIRYKFVSCNQALRRQRAVKFCKQRAQQYQFRLRGK